MKSLKLVLNIGTRDAQRLGLTKTLAGETVSVEADAADEMLRKGWATEPNRDTLDPRARPHASAELEPPTRGAAQDEVRTAAPANLDDLTKEELKAHADRQKIDGVTLAMTKDDMIKTIKKAGPAR